VSSANDDVRHLAVWFQQGGASIAWLHSLLVASGFEIPAPDSELPVARWGYAEFESTPVFVGLRESSVLGASVLEIVVPTVALEAMRSLVDQIRTAPSTSLEIAVSASRADLYPLVIWPRTAGGIAVIGEEGDEHLPGSPRYWELLGGQLRFIATQLLPAETPPALHCCSAHSCADGMVFDCGWTQRFGVGMLNLMESDPR